VATHLDGAPGNLFLGVVGLLWKSIRRRRRSGACAALAVKGGSWNFQCASWGLFLLLYAGDDDGFVLVLWDHAGDAHVGSSEFWRNAVVETTARLFLLLVLHHPLARALLGWTASRHGRGRALLWLLRVTEKEGVGAGCDGASGDHDGCGCMNSLCLLILWCVRVLTLGLCLF